ncbi:uncharacterized protein VICG_01007 [Vittaforma corneae ATCC 50505]|uniref:Sulfite reductase [NADPH] flavoprotein alpha-component-like FAD-binding domain-containing protein n=1 Tax=Vittaforma corneae (strain ATCC 50505) TaxID=993615 RepID=L2GNB3_VITCO|nr:uncharacterized protein VICG_01007 [Vittaforma corneae ATCC 50505]ELA41990.1 hypothetical protein VICG_01007 [Vittaforma corneae ATCC 50505]
MSPKVNYTFTSQFQRLKVGAACNANEKLKIEPSTLKNSDSFIFSSSECPVFQRAQLTEIKKIPTVWKETFKIQLDSAIEYMPCDSIGLLVPNSDQIVDGICKYCKFDNQRLKIERKGANGFIFDGMLRDFIKYRMDVNTIPKKKFLLELSKSSKKKNELEYICSSEGSRDYMSIGLRMSTLLDILEEFECEPTPEEFLLHCEILKPRYYSLIHEKGPAEILLGVISKPIDGEVVYGHVSRFIMEIYTEKLRLLSDRPDTDASCSIPIEYCIRQNKLFEGFSSKNVVCFCTGTGIAPFISFYRRFLLTGTVERLKLVYGFRFDQDNLLNYYDVNCDDVTLAKSSMGMHVYDFVDAISEFQNDCNVFICGNMKMQRDLFLRIKSRYPNLVENKRIYFDNWT